MKAVAVGKSKELIKQALKENPTKISPDIAKKIETKIATMTDDQIMAIGGKIANDFTIAEKTGDQIVYLSTLKDLDSWGKTIANRTDLPMKTKQLANELVKKGNAAGKKIAGKFKGENKAISQNASNHKDEIQIKEEGVAVYEAGHTLASISETFKDMDFISPEQKAGIEEVIAENKSLAAEVIQIADAKGYKLDNFTQLASIAGVGGGEGAETEVVATSDITQLNVLSKVKQAFNTLTEDVMNMLRDNREENKKLDESSAKITLEKKRDELKQIERDFIKKLQDKNIQNKLHLEVIALSYLLQNPEEMTPELVGAIKDEVNKIKWQAIYSRS
jgi:hypothetical protein